MTLRRHSCIAANYPSFDHFVSACEQRGRHSEVKSLGGFEVDHHIVFGVLLDGEVNRLGALENSSGVGPCLLLQASNRSPITHQPAAFGEVSDRINRGYCVAGRKRDNLLTPSDEENGSAITASASARCCTMMPKAAPRDRLRYGLSAPAGVARERQSLLASALCRRWRSDCRGLKATRSCWL